MKKVYITLLTLFFASVVNAQYGPQQIISTNADLAIRAIPLDMDNDGFIDVVSASYGDGKIAWYRNEDGLGNFSPEIIIGAAPVMEGMEMVDMDSDGDMDVIYKTNLDKIGWLENLDGQGTFGTERLIVQTDYPYVVATGDLDKDEDNDVLAIHYISGFETRLVWYENVDGLGNFGSEILVDLNVHDTGHLTIFDLDLDGDNDIITSYREGPSKLIWFENDGTGNFAAEQQIFYFGLSSSWPEIRNVTPSDFNGDGKIDLLFDTSDDEGPDYIYWIEHLDGQGDFGDAQLVYIKETSLGSLRSMDLDGDLDNDILVSFYWNANSLAWWENLDGQGTFGPKHVITNAVSRGTDATAADLNGDGDLDVISASSFDDKIAWYEYLKPLNVPDATTSTFQIYPNPTSGRIAINASESISEIQLYNTLGQEIGLIWTASEVDLSGIEPGIYFLKIISTDGFSETHKVVKK